jgi:hypothetical protein
MLALDMWYEAREPDFSKDDVLGAVRHNGLTGAYWANIMDQDGRYIGDITCGNFAELDKWLVQHGAKMDWGA